MASWSKTFKRYERHIMLALVILCLITFSVTGALAKCGGSADAGVRHLGGSFQATPTERVEISDEDLERRLQRVQAFYRAVNTLTLDFTPWLKLSRLPELVKTTWLHVVVSDPMQLAAAFAAGTDP